MTDAHSSPESMESETPTLIETRMNIAYLCNPNQEDSNVRGHHTSQLFSDELDEVEKRTVGEGCHG